MKVKFLTTLSGINIYHSDEVAEIEDAEALRLIDAGIAIPTSKKQYDGVLAKVLKAQAEQEAKENEITKLLYQDELLAERETLLSRVSEIEVILGIKIEEKEEIDKKEIEEKEEEA